MPLVHAIPALLTTGGISAASGTFVRAAVAPASQIFGPTVRRTGNPSTMALTFDDGPNPAVTPSLLDLLDREGVRATFFLTGEHVRVFPALAKEIGDRGHVIGNHTNTHPPMVFCSAADVQSQLDRCDEAIEEATGRKPRWMRPPFGVRGPALHRAIQRRGNILAMWSLSAADWRRGPVKRVTANLSGAKGGDIVLLHDGDFSVLYGDRQRTVVALEHWLPRWKEAGIRFVSLDQVPVEA